MNKRRILLFTTACILMLAVVIPFSISIGTRNIPLADLYAELMGREVHALYGPIIEKRMIRTLMGLIAGAALGVSGCLMQSITRNPVADPSILGVNTGASLAVVCGIAFWGISSPFQYIWFALLGAGVAALLVFGIATFTFGKGIQSKKNENPIRLALSGAAVSTACSSLISTVMLPRTNVMQVFRFWQTGSISGGSMESIRMVLPFILIGLVLAMILAPSLNVLALGDEMAQGLGVNVFRTRLLGALAGVLLCAAVTSIAGPIGFIGLMIPHMIRLILGPDLKVQMPLSALCGAELLLVSDIVGRVVGGQSDIEVGMITAFIGAPVFIWIVKKGRAK